MVYDITLDKRTQFKQLTQPIRYNRCNPGHKQIKKSKMAAMTVVSQQKPFATVVTSVIWQQKSPAYLP